MAKAKTVYVCSHCGMEYPKWYGQCPSCRQWNTLTETTLAPSSDTRHAPAWSLGQDGKKRQTKPLNIREVEYASQRQIGRAHV